MSATPASAATGPAGLPPLWPLALPFVALPVLWVLGVWQLSFFGMALVMAHQLLRHGRVVAPRGFWIWLLWLAWALTGLLVMQVNAPGTEPGTNMFRYPVFAYRYGWYTVATIFTLYVIATRRGVSTARIMNILAWFFVMLVAGGLLGLIAPTLSFDSLLQQLLPRGLASHSLVNELMHVQAAQLHSVLGDPSPRPSAPFIYTNGWGYAMAITAPLFVSAWWHRGGRWRLAMAGIVLIALVPIILSLNRGTWIALAAGAILAATMLAARGRVIPITIGTVAAMLALGALAFSPLGDVVTARLSAGHSDAGRENLSVTAIRTVANASPIVGFGTTRNVSGNFTSIAGGASDACPNCEPPPLGTHGQLWLTSFGAGFVGAGLYVGFLLAQFLGNLRSPSRHAPALLASVLTMVITLPIYNSIGVPLVVGFIAIGVLAREGAVSLPALHDTLGPVVRGAPLLLVCLAVGAGVGYGVSTARGPVVTATQRVLVPAADLAPVPGVRPSTLDTEALLATSTPVVAAIAEELGTTVAQAREQLSIRAEANTRVLILTYRATTAAEAEMGVVVALEAFSSARDELLHIHSQDLRGRYDEQRAGLRVTFEQVRREAETTNSRVLWNRTNALSREWSQTSGVLAGAAVIEPTRMISQPSIRVRWDETVVDVASGVGLAGLAGIGLTHLHDARFARLGRAPARRLRAGLPVAAQCGPGDIDSAQWAAQVYGASLIADPTRVAASRLAHAAEPGRRGGLRHARALLVVEPATRTTRARQLLARLRRAGIEPLGLVVCHPRKGGG